jgi:hypothetical protein
MTLRFAAAKETISPPPSDEESNIGGLAMVLKFRQS